MILTEMQGSLRTNIVDNIQEISFYITLIAQSDTEIKHLIKQTQTFINYIRIELCLDKCKMGELRHGE